MGPRITCGVVTVLCQSDPVKRAIGKQNWGNFCDFQSYCFKSAAEWQQAKQAYREAEKTSEGYGVEIAWLKRASVSSLRLTSTCC